MRIKQVCIGAALFTAATVLTGCDEYTVEVEYDCADGSSNTQTCKRWTQKGSIRKEVRCFPGDAVLIGMSGPVQMDRLRVGDEILGFDHSSGQVRFSKIRAWLHRETDTTSDMTVIQTEAGLLTASPKHGIAVKDAAGRTVYAFADEIQIGQSLISANGSATAVQKKSIRETRGLYTPLTGTSNFFIGQSEGAAVLAHSFAHLKSPRRYESALHGLMRIAEAWSPRIHDLNYESNRKYFHPVVRMLGPVARIIGVGIDSFFFNWERNMSLHSPNPRRLKGEGRRLGGGNNEEEEEAEWMALISVINNPLVVFNDGLSSR